LVRHYAPLGVAAVASRLFLGGLGNIPVSFAGWLNADLLDSCLLQLLHCFRATPAAVVDYHLRAGLLPKHLAIILQGCERHLSLVGPRIHYFAKYVSPGDTVDQPLQAERHFLACALLHY